MKLGDLLRPYEKVEIEYRTFGPNDEDMLAGACNWTGKQLEPMDGDSYSLEDRLINWLWEGKDKLTVWYESKWI